MATLQTHNSKLLALHARWKSVMTTIKSREPAVATEPTTTAKVEEELRKFVREGAANLRRSPESDSDLVAKNIRPVC